MSRTTPFAALLAAALGLVFTASASAQVAGTYNGTTSQGLSISLTLADDGNGGLMLTGDSVQWNETCHTGDTKFAWWGVGAAQEIVDGAATYTFASQDLYEVLKMHFSGDSVHGSFQGMEPTFVDVNTSRGKVEQCHSGSLTYTATLSAPAGIAPHAALRAGAAQAIPH
jgi:hypothetical protein